MNEVDENDMKELGRMMYTIIVKDQTPNNSNDDLLFELARKRGGRITDDKVLSAPYTDPDINSKDTEFIELCVKYGLGNELKEKVKAAYGK